MKVSYKRWIFLFASISFLFGLFTNYIQDYYKVDVNEFDVYKSISVDSEEIDNIIVYGNKKSKKGIIFYPGAKIDANTGEISFSGSTRTINFLVCSSSNSKTSKLCN